MSNKNITLAYSKENANIAKKLVQHLANTDYKIEEYLGENFHLNDSNVHQLVASNHPVLLLVSDNFLKSTNCMFGALKMLQQLSNQNRLLPIITDGRNWDEKNQRFVEKPTSFEKVSNVIQYMNFWQERYLEIRRKKRHIKAKNEEKINSKLKKIRSISSEVGEFLRHLRNLNFVHYEQLEKNQFKGLFLFMGDSNTVISNKSNSKTTSEEDAIFEDAFSHELIASNSSQDMIKAFQNGTKDGAQIPTEKEALDFQPEDDIQPIEFLDNIEATEEEINISAKHNAEETNNWSAIEKLAENATDDANETSTQQDTDDLIILEDIIGDSDTPQTKATDTASETSDNLSVEESLLALENIFGEETPTQTSQTNIEQKSSDIIEDVSPSEDEITETETETDENNDSFIESLLNWKDDKTPENTNDVVEVIETTEEEFSDNESVSDDGIIQVETLLTDTLSDEALNIEEQISQPENIETNQEEDSIVEKHFEEFEENEIINIEDIKQEESAETTQEEDSIVEKHFEEFEENEIINIEDIEQEESVETTHEEDSIIEKHFEEFEENEIINIEDIEQEVSVETTQEENSVVETIEIETLDISSIVNSAVAAPDLNHTFSSIKTTTETSEQEIEKVENTIESTIEQNMIEKPIVETKTKPSKSDLLFEKGLVAEENNDYKLARKYFKEVVDIDSDYPTIYEKLGRLSLYHFVNAKKASKYFKKAIKANPTNPEIHYQYANLMYEYAEKPKIAARHFKNTLKLQPNHPFAYYDLALIYYQLGDKFRANRAYLKAVENNSQLKTPQNDKAFAFTPQANLIEDTSKFKSLQKDIQKLEQLLITKQKQEAEVTPKKQETKTVFITGATSGIGRATAELFAKYGYRLILTGRRTERLKVIKGFFEKNYQSDIHTLPFDIRDLDAVKEAIDGLADEWRQIDILINNAGLAKGISPIHEGDIEEWDSMIDTNIKGLLYMTRAIAPYMVRRNEGHIINVCSTSGKEVYPGGNVYCATKFAVDALTKAMRIDLYKHKIRVSQVSPAHVEETEFSAVRFNGDTEKANKVYEDFRPLTSKDVAEAIYFMAARPAHVNVLDITLQGTQQASANHLDRSGR